MTSKTYTANDWLNFESRFRGKFFNSLLGPKPLALIGTTDKAGVSNLSLINSIVHIGANPPLIGFILRPTTVPRHTYENIRQNGDYTINLVSESLLKKAHQASAKYPRHIDEFQALDLRPEFINSISAPFVADSTIKIGMHFEEEHTIAANQTRLIVGHVTSVTIPENSVTEEGHIDATDQNTILSVGLDTYHKHAFVTRIPYANP